jgi:hypothetical protein
MNREFYTPEVLFNALKSVNIRSEFIYDSIDPKTGEQQMTFDYIKKKVDEIESKNNNVIGFVINVDEKQHYYAMKKLHDEKNNRANTAKYLKIDSLESEDNLTVFTIDEFNDVKDSKGIIIAYKKNIKAK